MSFRSKTYSFVLSLLVLSFSVSAVTVERVDGLENDTERFSYSIGYNFGRGLEQLVDHVNPSILFASLVSGTQGENPKLSPEEAQEIQQQVISSVQQEQEAGEADRSTGSIVDNYAGKDNVLGSMSDLSSETGRFSYAVGYSFGRGLEQVQDYIDIDFLISSLAAGMDGEDELMSEEEAQEIQQKVMMEIQQQQPAQPQQPQQPAPVQ
ncbi:FKBP-type peptidyl-prolyl cis-trans isomerase N-terminal domain-containing protein [Chitinivibrio alkaliphilus]|uniref:Peptidyl-prolyl cis-trans isomerase FKBP-type N-terminal domain-containing protein n=1 Tax=Chitinivibrio alkaliphilus ACht1 TaxID=1313304 RepID=U7D934_9BACT|nr:FKBP-type peptidyl-prolyl cis-trans isomerase N-terminal domain-containing protein [Chitinivibrio alkaliphilus]ERP38899.1 hypothetical protein CALK_0677 [Chitinivibrio alkaliphilus ACht1]